MGRASSRYRCSGASSTADSSRRAEPLSRGSTTPGSLIATAVSASSSAASAWSRTTSRSRSGVKTSDRHSHQLAHGLGQVHLLGWVEVVGVAGPEVQRPDNLASIDDWRLDQLADVVQGREQLCTAVIPATQPSSSGSCCTPPARWPAGEPGADRRNAEPVVPGQENVADVGRTDVLLASCPRVVDVQPDHGSVQHSPESGHEPVSGLGDARRTTQGGERSATAPHPWRSAGRPPASRDALSPSPLLTCGGTA